MTSRTKVPAPTAPQADGLSTDVEEDARYAWRMIFAFAQPRSGWLADETNGDRTPDVSRRSA